MSLPIEAIQLAIALSVALGAAVIDHRTGMIPNKLTFFALVLGVLLQSAFGGLSGLIHSVLAAAACGLVPVLLFRFGGMGGGDVKLFAAIGALVGLEAGLEIQSASFILGALYGIVVWAKEGQLASGLAGVFSLAIPVVGKRTRRRPGVSAAAKATIRFGPVVFAGAAFATIIRVIERGLA